VQIVNNSDRAMIIKLCCKCCGRIQYTQKLPAGQTAYIEDPWDDATSLELELAPELGIGSWFG
jgi:hypothetical protein